MGGSYFDDHGKPKREWPNDIPRTVEYPSVEHIKDIDNEDGGDGDDTDEVNGKAPDSKDRLAESLGTKFQATRWISWKIF